jgi:fumarate reductase subunit D
VLAIEFLAWRSWQKTAFALSAGASLAIGLAFLLSAF